MAKSFDFNKVRPKTMNVTLSDKEKTTLILLTPNKRLMDEVEAFRDGFADAEEEEVTDALYELTAKLMSRNKQGIEITSDLLKELYPEEDYILAFLGAYNEFISVDPKK
jgi:hypothetical protein